MDKINVEMEQIKKTESVDIDEQKMVYDSSVDHKGRVPLRSSTGVWKASLFIIGKHISNQWHTPNSFTYMSNFPHSRDL